MRLHILGYVVVAACLNNGDPAVATPVAPAAGDQRSSFVLVANQQAGNVSLINLATDRMQFIAVGEGPHEAVISPSGRVGVVTVYGVGGRPGNELAIIDITSASVVRTISLGQYTRPHGANFLGADESRVAVTSETTGNVVVVNIVEGRVEAAIPTNAQTSHMVAVTGDGKRGWTANILSGSVSEVDLVTRTFVRTIAVGPRSEGIAVTPDGRTVWAGSNTAGTVSVVDAQTGTVAATLTGFTMPYRLAISADGRLAVICDPQGDNIHVADVARREVLWSLGSLGSPRGVNISPNGKTAFVTLAADNTVAIIDLETRKLVRKIGVGASPDGVWYGPALP